jgi:hypothetical protein
VRRPRTASFETENLSATDREEVRSALSAAVNHRYDRWDQLIIANRAAAGDQQHGARLHAQKRADRNAE